METFRIDVPQADLDDLRDRLDRTRWPRQLPGDGWDRGVPVGALRAMADYWRSGFDWRRWERELNRFPQFITEIDGQDVHFLHVRSPRPDALPLLLTHGWPNSFVEFAPLIEPLVERGFHVVAPSVPGFGFSAPPRTTGFSVERVARLWASLMRGLGYRRYGTEGGDLGAYVAPAVAVAAPESVVGVYVISGLGFPDPSELADQEWMHGVDHHALLRAAPQTFAYGWQDSPVAALAWMMQKFHEFDYVDRPVDRDLLLTNASLYWFTGTFGSSSWPMYDTTGFAWPTGQKAAPTGVYSGPPGIRRLAERDNHIVHWPDDNPPAHHFVAMTQPQALAADLQKFFTKVRAAEQL